jgi:hypothetical protein
MNSNAQNKSDGIMAKYLVENGYERYLTTLFTQIHSNGGDSMTAVRNLKDYIPQNVYESLKDIGPLRPDALSHEDFSMKLLKLYDRVGGDRSNLDMKFVMTLPVGTRKRLRKQRKSRKNRKNTRKNRKY